MARKADIKNLIRDAEHKDQLVAEAEKNLKNAKENSAEAWDKVGRRRKELEQEKNNDLAAEVKSVFGEDITLAEFKKELDELLLIDEFKEYVEHEKAERRAAAERKAAEEAAKKSSLRV